MLKRSPLYYLLIAFTLSTISGCSGCCDITVLADLVSKLALGLTATFLQDDGNSQIFRMSNEFENSAADVAIKQNCKCSNTIEEAKSNNSHWNVYYSANDPNPTNWGQPQLSTGVDKSSLKPCEDDNTFCDVQFLASGYYLVENILDFTQQVTERNENNNIEYGSHKTDVMDNPFEANAGFGNNRNFKVMHIELSNEQPVYENGKRIFCRALQVK